MEVNMYSLAVSKITHKPLQTLILEREKTVLYFEKEKQNMTLPSGKMKNLLETARIKNTKPPVIKNYLSLELLVGKFHFLYRCKNFNHRTNVLRINFIYSEISEDWTHFYSF